MNIGFRPDHKTRSMRRIGFAALCLLATGLWLAGCGQGDDQPEVDVSQLRGTALIGERATEQREPDAPANLAGTRRDDEPRDDPQGNGLAEADEVIRPDFSSPDYFSIHEEAGPPLPIAPTIEGYTSIRWEQLQFEVSVDALWIEDFQPTDKPAKPDQSMVPAQVREYDGRKLAIIGYMIPINFRGGGTNEFMIVPIVPSCFFCEEPLPTEWIDVKTTDGRYVPYVYDYPVTVAGTLDVGAVYSGGMMESMFRLKADKVEPYEIELAF